jgi:hypothetical protein
MEQPQDLSPFRSGLKTYLVGALIAIVLTVLPADAYQGPPGGPRHSPHRLENDRFALDGCHWRGLPVSLRDSRNMWDKREIIAWIDARCPIAKMLAPMRQIKAPLTPLPRRIRAG